MPCPNLMMVRAKEKVSLKSTFIRTIKIYVEYKKALQQMKLKQK